MKTILTPLSPKECERVLNGEQTVLVRKFMPKEVPCRVVMYCTKQGKMFFHGGIGEKEVLFFNPDEKKYKFDYALELMCCKNKYTKDNFLSGKVVGEFVCEKAEAIYNVATTDWRLLAGNVHERLKKFVTEAGFTEQEIHEYSKGNPFVYIWHITAIKVYDKPKELSEFKTVKHIRGYHRKGDDGMKAILHADRVAVKHLSRPPSRYAYVEEIEE